MHVTGYSYPWDVDADFIGRAAELGVDEVAVAVAYHSARAATPWSERGTSVLARHAALYRPVRAGWGVLRPAPAGWVESPDSAGDAIRSLTGAGIPAAAWLVLTHNSLLGSAFPEHSVRNCFGEHYPWALCPAHEEVREFASLLTAEALADLDVRTVVLEACGQLGAVHQHQHEKTDAVWSPEAVRVLSVCCCPACTESWAERGIDPVATRELLRNEALRLISGEQAENRLPAEVRAVLLDTRQRATDRLRREVCEQIGAHRRVVLHASADPWATGALPGLTPAAAGEVDGVVVPCWKPSGPAEVAAASAVTSADIGAYVTAVGPEVPDMTQYVRELRAAGADELHLYHLGLAGPARWPHLRRAVEEAHS
ncbi:hypothetical protein SAMN02982929_00606 [Saccharopolyspora kobensis]|uniref:Alanine-rich protein n=1 Tax=Saccharopolyspora kobensis TaxID=146035 RepID=A0A1H5URX0_9PSEU|nr:hypothetical protein [Saccharopolyspora kobensis]SEF77178.1 hypothetical protein SAMN02982929_00606 [Saccharopolyspora kobensis]SFC70847.1 hypothetical protein SAMN05216506_1011464 [Saccharopolyspora kobensis]